VGLDVSNTDLAAVAADFRRDGACVVRGLLDEAEVARLAEGVEENLAAPSERAIEGGAESGAGASSRTSATGPGSDPTRESSAVRRSGRSPRG
jgi:hypothetical protein